MKLVARAVTLSLFLVALGSSEAAAAGIRLGLGADYWVNHAGLFNLTLAVDGALTRNISVGGRFGALIVGDSPTPGVPLDLVLRATVGGDRVYLEGMAGPWILFANDPVRAHAAFGFGLQGRSVAFGLELGWLSPRPILGVRLAVRI
jgi:hypothetical protein